VLVVTHLAQVAAFADTQYLVDKYDDGERAITQVRVLNAHERLGELSRMLSGMPDSDSGRSHAEELLALAGSFSSA
jgi:DNA repair protein RecN (Recombination protein N)